MNIEEISSQWKDHYSNFSYISEGSYGQVSKAINKNNSQYVAIKVNNLLIEL
jgi:hypothetical protein